jgi:transposase
MYRHTFGNRRGNRQLNKVLHTMAVIQIRDGGPGRDHYKIAEGKTEGEAIRSLKRQLSDVVYRRLRREQREGTVRGGQQGTRLSSA